MRIEAYTQEIQMISYNSNANILYLKQFFSNKTITTTNVIVMVRPGTHNVVFKSRFKL